MEKVILYGAAGVGAWLIVSQVIAGLLYAAAGNEIEATDELVDLWGAMFILVPMGIIYGLLYLLARVVFFWRPVTVDDLMP